jgi:hypothetical protein
MVLGGPGLSYTELKQMDLAEYREAVEARILYYGTWLPEAKERAKQKQK